MKDMSQAPNRVMASLPVVAAMIFHAIALQRWLLVLAAGLVLLATSARKITTTATLRRLIVACLLGAIAGVAFMVAGVSPASPLPPLAISVATGALLVLVVLFSMGGKTTSAWVCSWLLVAFSGSAEPSVASNLSLALFLVTSLIVTAYLAGVFDAGPQVLTPLVLFLALVLACTFGFSRLADRLEGVIQGAFAGMFLEGNLPSKTGVGNEILLAARSSIAISMEPLLELSDQSGRLRVNVMDRFEANRWFSSTEMRSVRYPTSESFDDPATAREIEVVLLEDPGIKLPSPAGTFDVRRAEAHFEGGWVARGVASGPSVELVGDSREQLPKESGSDPGLLEVPDELRDELKSYTEPLLIQAQDARAKAETLERFFQENFEYSLDTNLMGTEHPLIQLVRDRPPAYCVYFASAMALMLRTEGIPSRVVGGYLPTESNRLTGRVTVRQRDSHAWVEAWIPSEGRFVAYDPTPALSREKAIGTDRPPGMVSSAFGAIGSLARRTWLQWRSDPTNSLSSALRSPFTWLAIMVVLFLLARRRFAIPSAATAKVTPIDVDPRISRSYQIYLSALNRLGVTPNPWETDDELIVRLRDLVGHERADAASNFVASYRRVRYGRAPFEDKLVEMAELK